MPAGVLADAVTRWDSHTASSGTVAYVSQSYAGEPSIRLGHASVRTTHDWYIHLFEGHDDELLADLAGLVREAPAPTVPPSGTDVIVMGDR